MKCLWNIAAFVLLLSAFASRAVEAAELASSVRPDSAKDSQKPAALLLETGWSEGAAPVLRGRDARQQLIVTERASSGQLSDVTRQATFRAEPAGIVEIDATGLVKPLADGRATISAQFAGLTAQSPITVEHYVDDPQVNFPNQIVPVFTKFGCNSGGCHGKASGQNGFKLSLLGFEPGEDHEHLVKEGRGRRLFPAAPEQSLLLVKATNSVPHGGGQRLGADSHEYRLLARWIR
ncbi:MAG TPA: S-layer protein, partial [Pirellulales bacterium]|nr:S-layer protein [Pirellulales bacterium]